MAPNLRLWESPGGQSEKTGEGLRVISQEKKRESTNEGGWWLDMQKKERMELGGGCCPSTVFSRCYT